MFKSMGRSSIGNPYLRLVTKLTLTFDPEDYEEKEILAGDASLVQALYEDEHLIIVNKPEGMKTHANQPDEIALLNHVSTYVGKTVMSFIAWTRRLAGLLSLPRILLFYPS